MRHGRELIGYAVVYRNKPVYTGLDCFLVCVSGNGTITHATDGHSVGTAAIYINRHHAVAARDAHPYAGAAHEDGEVREVYAETRYVLGDRP